jgi:hypothetical protein
VSARKVYIVISFCVCELRIAQPLSVGLSFLRHAGTVVDARAGCLYRVSEPRWLSTVSAMYMSHLSDHVCLYLPHHSTGIVSFVQSYTHLT